MKLNIRATAMATFDSTNQTFKRKYCIGNKAYSARANATAAFQICL